MSNKIKQKKGFTIIEVVLVLAIAGLIFLMVFIVLPQAMAGQRDGERRQAMSRVQSALVQYQTNNKSKRNNLPNDGTSDANGGNYEFTDSTDGEGFGSDCGKNFVCSFIKNYLNTTEDVADNKNMFLDPDGLPYNMVITKNLNLTKGDVTPAYIPARSDESKLEGTGANGIKLVGSNPLKAHVIYIVTGAKCDGEQAVTSDLRHFAVLYRLENSSVYCGDSD